MRNWRRGSAASTACRSSARAAVPAPVAVGLPSFPPCAGSWRGARARGAAASLSRRPREVRAMTLPARKLRRQPYDVEVRAAVDFGALDAAFNTAAQDAEALYRQVVIPAQIEALASGIRNTKAGEPRKVLTKAAMAALQAPREGRDELAAILLDAARVGMSTALAEAQAQGVILTPVEDAVLAQMVGDQADALTTMAADGISIAAARKATALVGGGRTPEDVAGEVETHLRAMKHQWTADQLRGAVQMAQNGGRLAVMEQAEGAVGFYSSELLDTNTCERCVAIDGKAVRLRRRGARRLPLRRLPCVRGRPALPRHRRRGLLRAGAAAEHGAARAGAAPASAHAAIPVPSPAIPQTAPYMNVGQPGTAIPSKSGFRSIYFLGDSLTAGIFRVAPAYFPGWKVGINGVGGRPLNDGMGILAATALPERTILAMGLFTNDLPTRTWALKQAVRESLRRVGPSGCVIWATIHRPAVGGPSWQGALPGDVAARKPYPASAAGIGYAKANAALRALAAQNPNMRLVA
jgi:hypothetical protein